MDATAISRTVYSDSITVLSQAARSVPERAPDRTALPAAPDIVIRGPVDRPGNRQVVVTVENFLQAGALATRLEQLA